MSAGQVRVAEYSVKRTVGREAQRENIAEVCAVADVLKSTLGPKALLKMLMHPMGGVILTNDGNAILREIDVKHPAAKTMLEICRVQDDEVGDGTTSVMILAGEFLNSAGKAMDLKMHPTEIVRHLYSILEKLSTEVKNLGIAADETVLTSYIEQCVNAKFSHTWGTILSELAVNAVECVTDIASDGTKMIDIKRYCRIEKIQGGVPADTCLIKGIVLNKDVTHAQMRRQIDNPRVLLLDCPLEYKKDIRCLKG